MADGTPWDLELPFITAKGRHLWVRALGQATMMEGAVVSLNGAFQDITERKNATEAIVQANRDLEGFSYSISHDLRAPLRAIDGFIGMLQLEHAPCLNADAKRMFGIVSDNARKMSQLIDDILAFSRAGRLELQVQPVDMQTLVREVWSALSAGIEGRAIDLRLGDLPIVHCDRSAIRQVERDHTN